MEIPRDKLDVRDDPQVLSPPILSQPLYGCAKAVNVTGYVPDASLDVEINGSVAVSGFPGNSPSPFGATIKLPNPLKPGWTVRVRQQHGGAASGWSPNPAAIVRDHTVDFPAGLPRPEIFPTPLYKCGVRTGVGNLLVGCDVRVTADNAQVGSASGANNPQGININPAFDTNPDQHVRAWATLCNDPSPPSLEWVVQPPPLPLPPPGFDPAYDGGTQIVVNTITDGAHFTLSRGGALLGTIPCWGGKCQVGINPSYHDPESFSATQELCPSDGPSNSGTMTVQPCSALPAPQVGPVQAGDSQIVLTQFVAGSEIKVFVNNVKTGDGSGPVVGLTDPIPHEAKIDVWQIVGTCQGSTVQELNALCFAPPVVGDPSALDLFPVGTHEYDAGPGGRVTFDGFTYDVRGSMFYPADDDGVDQPFNQRLAKLGRVPIVVCVHGAHSEDTPSYQGYDYFQYQLAQMGFVAISVDERATDQDPDWSDSTQNIVRRAELAIASIAFMQQLDANGPIFNDAIDFARTGLMGHSRGGDCVIAVTERITLPGVTVRAVLSLAPVNSGANNGRPQGYDFMTFLPAADGDVVDNNGAQFYDQAVPTTCKTQLYIDQANHNFFNRKWTNDDAHGMLPIMSRPDHERILSTYGCAFFRFSLRGDATFSYLDHTWLPYGVQNQNIHLACDLAKVRSIDRYEGHPITADDDGQATSQLGGLVAKDFAFAQGGGAFNSSFFGNTTGNVCIAKEKVGAFREPLAKMADLTNAEVRVRAAEVYQQPNIPANATGFRVGVEDGHGTIGWVDVDDVGGLSRTFDRRAYDGKTKTMLSTYRFPGPCFKAAAARLALDDIRAIHLGLNRGDGRPIAFDDVEIVAA